MTKCEIGDFVETIHGVNGIVTSIKRGYYNDVVLIATSDMRTFCCSICAVKQKKRQVPKTTSRMRCNRF